IICCCPTVRELCSARCTDGYRQTSRITGIVKRKLESPERTHACTGRTCTLHAEKPLARIRI
ncbi:hypothetical protein ATANTOWER_024300, partial [Ataeniobius toweri]|nr:hypothetical protein [Ataeniobius toweri]